MKYNLEISGGFANMVEKYTGEMRLDGSQKKDLKKLLEKYSKKEFSKEARDTFVYHFNLILDDTAYQMAYDDTTLPLEMITLVDAIRKNRKS